MWSLKKPNDLHINQSYNSTECLATYIDSVNKSRCQLNEMISFSDSRLPHGRNLLFQLRNIDYDFHGLAFLFYVNQAYQALTMWFHDVFSQLNL